MTLCAHSAYKALERRSYPASSSARPSSRCAGYFGPIVIGREEVQKAIVELFVEADSGEFPDDSEDVSGEKA